MVGPHLDFLPCFHAVDENLRVFSKTNNYNEFKLTDLMMTMIVDDMVMGYDIAEIHRYFGSGILFYYIFVAHRRCCK